MKHALRLAAPLFALTAAVAGCSQGASPGGSTPAPSSAAATPGARTVTDMAGRTVTLKATATKVFGAGPPATEMLYTLDPGVLAGWNTKPSDAQRHYLTPESAKLPVLGRVTGGKDPFNPEVLLQNGVDLIVDAGDINDKYRQSADDLQSRTGIPVVMLSTDPATMDDAYRLLGDITGRAEPAKTLAAESDRLWQAIDDGAKKVGDAKKSVYYAVGAKGLTTAQSGSINGRAFDMVGLRNAAGTVQGTGSGRIDVDAEKVMAANPDWVVVVPDAPTDQIATDPKSSQPLGGLQAFADGHYLVAPTQPFGWVDAPPASNQLLGMAWLGESIYPDQFDVDVRKEVTAFYRTFYHVDLTEDQITELLKKAHTPGF